MPLGWKAKDLGKLMVDNYQTLLDYAQEHKDNLVDLAKTINSWEWASIRPSTSEVYPVDAADVANLLSGACGFRTLLMRDIFATIDVPSRIVNFYDVPFQVGHTTVELLIDGKWMWFDPTFGTFITSGISDVPISIAEARLAWPSVTVQQCSAAGWGGVFFDLEQAQSTTYSPLETTFLSMPLAYGNNPLWVAGEVSTLYFGANAAYYDLETATNISVATGNRTWQIFDDGVSDKNTWLYYSGLIPLGNYNWLHYENFYKDGVLDFKWGRNDDGKLWFIDYELENQFAWKSKTTWLTKNYALESVTTVNDDATKVIKEYDAGGTLNWIWKETYFSESGVRSSQSGLYDDGKTWFTAWDWQDRLIWSFQSNVFDSSGLILTTIRTSDDTSSSTINWRLVMQSGSLDADVLRGNSGSNLLVGLDGNDALYGLDGDDALYGGNGNDYLIGGAGSDLMYGGGGNDSYYVDDVGDQVYENLNEGLDTVFFSISSYALPNNVENGYINTSGASNATGNGLNNVIYAGAGNNVIDGGAGNDTVSYYYSSGKVNVSLSVVTAQDTLGSGYDTLISIENLVGSNAGDDLLAGNNAANVLQGMVGNDALYGLGGNDTLYGGNGNDYLIGGAGSDLMYGGTGSDIFYFGSLDDVGLGSAMDCIGDFDCQFDRLDFTGFDANTVLEGNQAFSFLGTASFSGAAGQLRFDSGTLWGDVSGDMVADFGIKIIATGILADANFIL